MKAEPTLSKPVTGNPLSSVPSPGTAQSIVPEKEGMSNMMLVSHTLVAESLPSVVAGKVVLIPENVCYAFQFLSLDLWCFGLSKLIVNISCRSLVLLYYYKCQIFIVFNHTTASLFLSLFFHCSYWSKNNFQDP